MAPSLRWDIFCRVVDNFGDAGVCWRLARQLAHEHGIAVTLWIDDVATLARIAPALVPQPRRPGRAGVRVRRLAGDAAPDAPLPDVVIEAFGCGLPDRYVAAMADRARPPVWVVLEYLSAEPWIDASHGAAVAASAAAADALVLVPRIHAAAAAGCCARPGSSRRATPSAPIRPAAPPSGRPPGSRPIPRRCT